jgi:hypothetical protein
MQYEFVTRWALDEATADCVYETLSSNAYGEWWTNMIAPLMKPLFFVWNHDHVMHRGALGLAYRLQATLVQG